MSPSITNYLMDIELAGADLHRVAVILDLVLSGMNMSNMPESEKKDSFDLIVSTLNQIYDRIYEARERIEDELKSSHKGV